MLSRKMQLCKDELMGLLRAGVPRKTADTKIDLLEVRTPTSSNSAGMTEELEELGLQKGTSCAGIGDNREYHTTFKLTTSVHFWRKKGGGRYYQPPQKDDYGQKRLKSCFFVFLLAGLSKVKLPKQKRALEHATLSTKGSRPIKVLAISRKRFSSVASGNKLEDLPSQVVRDLRGAGGLGFWDLELGKCLWSEQRRFGSGMRYYSIAI